jgi:hypothetical protein
LVGTAGVGEEYGDDEGFMGLGSIHEPMAYLV